LAKTILTEEEKLCLKGVASELFEIRKLIDVLAETMVNLSDKEFLKVLNASQDDGLNEHQMEGYRVKLERQVDLAEKEFQA
jgi:hypothetical protein